VYQFLVSFWIILVVINLCLKTGNEIQHHKLHPEGKVFREVNSRIGFSLVQCAAD
jgi:hypothetical protein